MGAASVDKLDAWPIEERRAFVDRLKAEFAKKRERRQEMMPSASDAAQILSDVHSRLAELGWRKLPAFPVPGHIYDCIVPGCSGVWSAHYEGLWPSGNWIVHLGDGIERRPYCGDLFVRVRQ